MDQELYKYEQQKQQEEELNSTLNKKIKYQTHVNDWLLTEFDDNNNHDDIVIEMIHTIDNYFKEHNIDMINNRFINQFISFLYENSSNRKYSYY